MSARGSVASLLALCLFACVFAEKAVKILVNDYENRFCRVCRTVNEHGVPFSQGFSDDLHCVELPPEEAHGSMVNVLKIGEYWGVECAVLGKEEDMNIAEDPNEPTNGHEDVAVGRIEILAEEDTYLLSYFLKMEVNTHLENGDIDEETALGLIHARFSDNEHHLLVSEMEAHAKQMRRAEMQVNEEDNEL